MSIHEIWRRNASRTDDWEDYEQMSDLQLVRIILSALHVHGGKIDALRYYQAKRPYYHRRAAERSRPPLGEDD
jgi:hypothetical protein